MKVLTEADAEKFLERNGFAVVERVYVKNKSGIENAVRRIGFPLVMKVSGEKIVHKNRVGGIATGIKNSENALKTFDKLMKIKGAVGVMIQKQLAGKEFLLGLKKTREFGHVVAFGTGGIHTEKLGDVSFRVCPIEPKERRRMISETKISKDSDKEILKEIDKNIHKLCKLSVKYSQIKELDINPLIQGKIVDARIVVG